jgi:hypothetical protein
VQSQTIGHKHQGKRILHLDNGAEWHILLKKSREENGMTHSDISASIADHFGSLPDPRVERTKLHKLIDILVIAICGVICHADSWEEVEAFGKAKEAWLRKFLELPHGIPSHDTFNRVFARLDAKQFESHFIRWITLRKSAVRATRYLRIKPGNWRLYSSHFCNSLDPASFID